MNNKTRSTKSEKWRHTRTSNEIAWTNERKADLKWLWRHIVVKIDDEIKKNIAVRIPEATPSLKTLKTEIAAEVITYCIKP